MADDVKYVKFMPEYTSTGVWNIGGANIEISDVPLSPELTLRLEAWNAWYDHNDSWRCDEGYVRTFPLKAFSDEGEQIARHFKAAHPDWTVRYFNEYMFDEAEARAGDGPRSYEYEIE